LFLQLAHRREDDPRRRRNAPAPATAKISPTAAQTHLEGRGVQDERP
jgi:hypothetical protein